MSLGTTSTRRVLIGRYEHPITISKLMPTSPTNEITQDLWIRSIYIVNKSGMTAAILVCDMDSPSVYLVNTSLPDGGMLSLTDNDGVYMRGGLTWSSSQSNVSIKMAGSLNP